MSRDQHSVNFSTVGGEIIVAGADFEEVWE